MNARLERVAPLARASWPRGRFDGAPVRLRASAEEGRRLPREGNRVARIGGSGENSTLPQPHGFLAGSSEPAARESGERELDDAGSEARSPCPEGWLTLQKLRSSRRTSSEWRLARVGTPALVTGETEWKMPRVKLRPGPFHAARSRRPRLTGSTPGTSHDVPAGRRRRTLCDPLGKPAQRRGVRGTHGVRSESRTSSGTLCRLAEACSST